MATAGKSIGDRVPNPPFLIGTFFCHKVPPPPSTPFARGGYASDPVCSRSSRLVKTKMKLRLRLRVGVGRWVIARGFGHWFLCTAPPHRTAPLQLHHEFYHGGRELSYSYIGFPWELGNPMGSNRLDSFTLFHAHLLAPANQ